MIEAQRASWLLVSKRHGSLSAQGAAQRSEASRTLSTPGNAAPLLQAPHPAARPMGNVYLRVRAGLKALIDRIDLTNFPGSCCG
ncbi:hypothetical protein SAMN05443247_11236 [Bradyrhizobium erythrophlei]|jgi:hypothetical protein|nr:hypothetical protein SAMN05443247_11236 [Bradyrhizobium erythrophlei]